MRGSEGELAFSEGVIGFGLHEVSVVQRVLKRRIAPVDEVDRCIDGIDYVALAFWGCEEVRASCERNRSMEVVVQVDVDIEEGVGFARQHALAHFFVAIAVDHGEVDAILLEEIDQLLPTHA